MWPDRVSNPGPLTYESGALPTALRGPAYCTEKCGKLIINGYSVRKERILCFKSRPLSAYFKNCELRPRTTIKIKVLRLQ